jgi:hypothetical protein
MKQNFYVEKERAICHIISIAIDATIDTHSRIGNLAWIVIGMLQSDKSRLHLVQVERMKRFAWSIRKEVSSNNRHLPA